MTSPSASLGDHPDRDRRERLEFYGDEGRGAAWLFFAGTIVGLAGIMRIFDAIWAFGYKGALPDGLQDGVLGSDLKHYAWLWLVVGIVLVLASVLILTRSQVARWIGFVAAVVMAVSAMAWMPYYPVWSVVYIALAVMTFYALSRYGGPERS